jgi:glutamyl-Q tRNA(Asp) synthetase
MNDSHAPYIGRFAPSPSGPLHFGSLITALASFLDAKHHQGEWLVRMEDIDPPREETGAAERILASLQAHQLYSDGAILYQSTRLSAYQAALDSINHATYRCQCGRQQLSELQGIYDGRCRSKDLNEHVLTSVRVHLDSLSDEQRYTAEHFRDIFQGTQQQSLKNAVGDFILRRKDGLFAYQLAVACDDIAQGVTHIIRGSDLLSSTPRQRYVIQLLKQQQHLPYPLPNYGHIPVASNRHHQKLSKQHKAKPLDDKQAFTNLCRALAFLHHPVPSDIQQHANIDHLLTWAVSAWQRDNIPQALSFVVEA